MLGSKFVIQQYTNFNATDSQLVYNINRGHNDDPTDLRNQRFFLIEPFMDMNAGFKNFMFKCQLGFSAQWDGNARITSYLPIYAGVGVTCYIRLKKKAVVDTMR